MISIISFIIAMFGCINWLCIGFFQYDIVAGFFGYQGSIFSRAVYIFVGIAACVVIFSVIKNKGRLNPQKLIHDERPLYSEKAKEEKYVRAYMQENGNQTGQNSSSNQENNKPINQPNQSGV